MRRRTAVAVVSAVLALAACADASGPGSTTGSHNLALAPDDPGADGVVRGVVKGDRLTNPADTTSFELVAGAKVTVYLEFDRLPADSANGVKHTLMGTVTSDTRGAFELDRVPSGYYRLDIAPPAGTPYQATSSGTLAFAAHTTQKAVVWLRQR